MFDLWVKARYISVSDIETPSHHNIDIPRLQRLGFDSEVVDLVQQLPALRLEAVWSYQEEGVELIPREKMANYFVQPSGVGDEMFEDLRCVDWADKEAFEPCCAEIVRTELAETTGTPGTAVWVNKLNTSSRRL
ncbi:hypothetical protein CNMCM5623_003671 [Aspergillus felis]|uniref:Uncharacterized protein n=1 Tax=Aspergillus felis TaxID=1287682 RepID=A0A8H6QKJ2_9EURO|nr:hypothetical protein CNMCM5623_003671 [Aspergillus felis]KAF7174698.1 hypothetical protein CNMCM7691_003384 [Aspergillus felis]